LSASHHEAFDHTRRLLPPDMREDFTDLWFTCPLFWRPTIATLLAYRDPDARRTPEFINYLFTLFRQWPSVPLPQDSSSDPQHPSPDAPGHGNHP
jgi:hypothetical protein